MIDRGILQSGDPIELLEGLLVPKMTKNSPRTATLRKLFRLLNSLVGTEYDVHTQDPIATSDSEPEPDLSVVLHDDDDYRTAHPTAAQTVLVCEVADSSVSIDRGLKQQIYARAGIRLYWIVNLVDQQIEVYSDPQPEKELPDFKLRLIFTLGQSIPLQLGNIQGMIAVSQVFSNND